MQSNLTEAEAAIKMRAFEKRDRAFEYRVRGTSLWQFIRFEVSIRLQGIDLKPAALGRRRLLSGILRGLWQLLWLPRAEVVGKTFDSAIRRRGSDGFEDIYYHDLRPLLGGLRTMSSADVPGYETNRRHAAIPSVFDDTSIIALSAILGRVLPLVRRDSAFQNLAAAIEDGLGMDRYTAKSLQRLYNVFAWRVILYRAVLSRLRPRVLLCPDSGQFALMRAAELEAIAFVEMQHGLFSGAHPNALPGDLTEEEISGAVTPTKLAVYGQFSADQLSHSWVGVHRRIVPVGAAFLSNARKARQARFTPGEAARITLTTQGIARQALADFIAQFLDQCLARFELVIKLHPAYDADAEFYRNLLGSDSRVRIVDGLAAESTHELIALSDLHISISSACHFDALGMGTPTGILQLDTYESVLDVIRHQGALLVESPADLARIVTDRAFPAVPQSTSRYFFETDFEEQLPTLINTLRQP